MTAPAPTVDWVWEPGMPPLPMETPADAERLAAAHGGTVTPADEDDLEGVEP